MSILVSAQYKLTNQIAEQALSQLRAQKQQNKNLESQLTEVRQDLAVAKRQNEDQKAQINTLQGAEMNQRAQE